jgi:hypothetical protein
LKSPLFSDCSAPVDSPFNGGPIVFGRVERTSPTTGGSQRFGAARQLRRKTMITMSKLALIAAVAVVGIVSPAFAQGAGPGVTYQLPSEMPGFGAQTAPRNGQVAVHRGPLYNSVVTPNDNWAYDSEWSGANRAGR